MERILPLVLAGLLLAFAKGMGQGLTLPEAIRTAQQQSPTAQLAQQRVAQASAKASQASAAFYPVVRVVSSYGVSDNPVQAFMYGLNQGEFSMAGDFNNPATSDNWLVSAQLQYRLFAGGRDAAHRQAARSVEHGLEQMRRATDDELTLQVTRSYLSVLTAAEIVRAAEAAVKDFEASEQVMASRVSAGTALRTGLLELQVQLAQAEERLLASTNGYELAKESLRFAMGLDSLAFADFGRLDDLDLPEPSQSGGAERPEVLARSAFSRAARAEHRAAKGGYLPTVSAFATADRYQGWEFDGTKESWTAGVSLEWQLFDGFLTPSQVREKRAAVMMAEAEERAARLQSSMESRTASLRLQDATERVSVMQRAAALATEHVTLTRQRFDQGLMLPSEVIDAENALVQAEVGLAQAKADRQMAIAQLRRALGMSITGEVSR